MHEGKAFGPWRVLRRLGAGGMGEVFLVEHSLIGRKAAIKVLHDERTTSKVAVERFFNEARATSVVSDPGIVQVFDFGIAPDNTAYIVMELLDGESLQARLHRVGMLPITDALRIVRQAAGSLAAAHAAGIIHRDLKPDNLFLVRDPEAAGGERPKILDFGIAKLDGEIPSTVKTRTGAVMGTPVYMSPEQCNDSGKIDHRTDIYSLGCVLHYLLTGSPPFDHDGVGALISAHLNEPPKRPSQRLGHIPPAVDAIVMKCLAKRPDERFESMLELQHACDTVARDVASMPTVIGPAPVMPAVTPAPPTTLGAMTGQQQAAPARSSKGVWIGIATVGLAAVLGIVVAIATTGSKDLDPAAMPNRAVSEPPAPSVAPEPKPPPKPVVEETHVDPPRAPPDPPPPIVDPPPTPVATPSAGSAKPPLKKKPVVVKKRPGAKPDDLYDDR